MRLRDLAQENPDHLSDWKAPLHLKGWNHEPDFMAKFENDWAQGRATLREWVAISWDESRMRIIEENLTHAQREVVKARQRILFDWYLEYRVQKIILETLGEVINTTPKYAVQFAKMQLESVEGIFEGRLNRNESVSFSKSLGLSIPEILLPTVKTQDIHSHDSCANICILRRYQHYLQAFIQDGILEYVEFPLPKNESFIAETFPNTWRFGTSITIEYIHELYEWEGKLANSYTIESVNGGQDTLEFKAQLRKAYQADFLWLLDNVYKNVSSDLRKDSFHLLSEAAHDLKYLVIKTSDVLVTSKDESKRPLLIFRNAKYIGNKDELIWEDVHMVKSIGREIESFAKAFSSTIEEFSRQLEYAAFNLPINPYQSSEKKNQSGNLDKDQLVLNAFESKIKNNLPAINNLRKDLISGNYIHPTTTTGEFRALFSGQPINTKIIWMRPIADLACFIQQLLKQDKVTCPTNKHWNITCVIFQRAGFQEITNSMLSKADRSKRLHQIQMMVADL